MPGKTKTAAALIAVVVLLAGCTPEPEPTPTPTGFTSEAEAFAAAEETYRAYVEAGNQVDLSDPATFEPVLSWTTGEQKALEHQSFTQLHAEGVSVSGQTNVVAVELLEWSRSTQLLRLTACQDVSDVDLVDSAGNSMVSEDREPLQAQDVELVVVASSPTAMLIQRVDGAEDDSVCGD